MAHDVGRWLGGRFGSLLLVVLLAFAVLAVVGCANGPDMREVVFGARAALVLDGDPTREELDRLLSDGLELASEHLNPEQIENARLLITVALALHDSDGDWREAVLAVLDALSPPPKPEPAT